MESLSDWGAKAMNVIKKIIEWAKAKIKQLFSFRSKSESKVKTIKEMYEDLDRVEKETGFKFDRFKYDTFEYDKFKYDRYEYDKYKYDKFGGESFEVGTEAKEKHLNLVNIQKYTDIIAKLGNEMKKFVDDTNEADSTVFTQISTLNQLVKKSSEVANDLKNIDNEYGKGIKDAIKKTIRIYEISINLLKSIDDQMNKLTKDLESKADKVDQTVVLAFKRMIANVSLQLELYYKYMYRDGNAIIAESKKAINKAKQMKSKSASVKSKIIESVLEEYGIEGVTSIIRNLTSK